MCHLVALDDGTPIKGAFIAMCEALQLNHDIFAKCNYKGLTVEYFHRFLIKSVTTATEERGTNDMFVPTGIAASYAWNSVLISATDILCSIPAIYRELHFPLDISLNALPKLTKNNGQAVLDHLKLTNSARHFSVSIFKIIIEDRRTSHAERIDNNRNLVILKPGNTVIARIVIQSDKKKEKVDTLCYVVKGPYQIPRNTGHGSYFVKKLHKSDSPELKFIAYDLYPIPPSLKPCEPIDITDTRYLNQSHVSLTNLLKKDLHNKLYNDKLFNKPLQTSFPSFTYQHDSLKILTKSYPSLPSVIELHEEIYTCLPPSSPCSRT